MAQRMQTHTRWEDTDRRLHREQELPATQAKQGNAGRRVLAVLVAALVLAFIVWIPVEIWGSIKAAHNAPAPQQTTTAPPTDASQTPAEADAEHR